MKHHAMTCCVTVICAGVCDLTVRMVVRVAYGRSRRQHQHHYQQQQQQQQQPLLPLPPAVVTSDVSPLY
jgi:hypothetical protein